MLTGILELSLKQFVAEEELTEEEKKKLREYDIKYKLVRFLVMEKRNQVNGDKKLKDFQFTPGDKFLETPTIDIVNSIIESFSLPARPLDFGDGTFEFDENGIPLRKRFADNPPRTGIQKKSIFDL